MSIPSSNLNLTSNVCSSARAPFNEVAIGAILWSNDLYLRRVYAQNALIQFIQQKEMLDSIMRQTQELFNQATKLNQELKRLTRQMIKLDKEMKRLSKEQYGLSSSLTLGRTC